VQGFDPEAIFIFFIEEAQEHLAELSEALIELEKVPEDQTIIHKLFRIAHTLKGSAAMMDLTAISKLSHKMEDLFAALRDMSLKADNKVIDILLRASDELKLMVDKLQNGEKTLEAPNAIMAEIDSILYRFDRKIEEEKKEDITPELPKSEIKPVNKNEISGKTKKEKKEEKKEEVEEKFGEAEQVKNKKTVSHEKPSELSIDSSSKPEISLGHKDEIKATSQEKTNIIIFENKESLEPNVKYFVEEVELYLNTVFEKLEILKKAKNDKYTLKELFSFLNLIANSAAMMNFEDISDSVETLIDFLKRKELTDQHINTASNYLMKLSKFIKEICYNQKLSMSFMEIVALLSDDSKHLETSKAEVEVLEILEEKFPKIEEQKLEKSLPQEEAPASEQAEDKKQKISEKKMEPPGKQEKVLKEKPEDNEKISSPPKNQHLLKFFIEEAKEHIEVLQEKLIEFEKDPGNKDTINVIFRTMHTLKGSAAMMGLNNLSELAHKCEDLLSKLREEKISFSSEISEILFESTDTFVEMLRTIESGADTEKPIPLIEKIQEICDRAMIVRNIEEPEDTKKKQDAIYHGERRKQERRKQDRRKHNRRFADRVYKEPVSAQATQTVRVSIEKLDNLINLVGELVLNKIRLDQRLENMIGLIEKISQFSVDLSKLQRNMEYAAETEKGVNFNNFEEIFENIEELKTEFLPVADKFNSVLEDLNVTVLRVGKVTNELQEKIMKVRMFPISMVFSQFPRIVRDLSKKMNKKINFKIYGEHTELDKTVIEKIGDPLMHLIRNTIDHGIESKEERLALGKSEEGNVELSATHKGNNIIIEVRDDGRGINSMKVLQKAIEMGLVDKEEAEHLSEQDILKFIFAPGFSTKENVTAVSGRGVGMDVVKTNIELLKGTIDVETVQNEGTRFIIKLPLTLAIIQALIVETNNQRFAIPLSSVIETLSIANSMIKNIGGKTTINLRNEILPLVKLSDILMLEETEKSLDTNVRVVIVASAEKKMALVVDKLCGKQEIVIKSLGDYFKKVKNIAGATILGDGTVLLILDVTSIVNSSLTRPQRKLKSNFGAKPFKKKSKNKVPAILAVDDSPTIINIEKSLLKSWGFNVFTAENGLKAMEILKSENIDLVITDIEMPQMDGIELTKWIRADKQLSKIPIIIITTKALPDDRKRGYEAGASLYLGKPFEQERLLNAIKKLLG